MRKFVAILDTMWGTGGRAPQWFLINPQNHSGRRLYKLTGARYGDLVVVNACAQQTRSARHHGTPSVEWLAASLAAVPTSRRGAVLLVCGAVAQRTYDRLAVPWNGPVVRMPHPASRTWTRAQLLAVRKQIAKAAR